MNTKPRYHVILDGIPYSVNTPSEIARLNLAWIEKGGVLHSTMADGSKLRRYHSNGPRSGLVVQDAINAWQYLMADGTESAALASASTAVFPAWGLRPETPRRLMWGARAILTDGHVDLLPNRGEMIAPEADREAFAEFIDAALIRVRSEARSMSGSSRERREFTADNGATVRYSTNASHGYLYVGVWADGVPSSAPFTANGEPLKARTLDSAKREAFKTSTRTTIVLHCFGRLIAHRSPRGWVDA